MMVHEPFDLDRWVQTFPLAGMKKDADISSALTGPLPVAYVEQIRSEVKRAGGNLGQPVPVDLCVWKLGDARRRDVTKIGGVPYWPAGEPWPWSGRRKPYTFIAQFCFKDSEDILPRLPGDVLSVLAAGPDYQNLELRWFQFGAGALMPADKIPAARWAIQPCHAVLHRTAEYPEADYELFEKYPYPLSLWSRNFTDGSKIGGAWELRGDLPDPADIEDPKFREEIRQAWEGVRQQQRTFLCQLGSVQATGRRPFLNVEKREDLVRSRAGRLLMIADVGGYDFFYDGMTTDYSSWSG